ncbi:SMP-30/gluconolactonase/LRE family protein [Rhizorhabdus sp. FW153]|uniref:hypothetical protein n=1 Tax=Rhizorhabdus sp. FW153 TaxID=3400216 RepID=UPI003CE85ECC
MAEHGWASGELRRHSADGTLLRSLTVPYPHIVSVDFGAGDPSSLSVSTEGNARHPNAGAVLRIAVTEPGLPGAQARLELFAHRD